MTTCVVWDNRLAQILVEHDDVASLLDDILEMTEHMSMWRTDLYRAENFYDLEPFSTWLYNYSEYPELRDLKKEFSKVLSRSKEIDTAEYSNMLDHVERQNCADKLLLAIHQISSQNELFVDSVHRYFSAKQWYLSNYISKTAFLQSAEECFPRLFFHDKVEASMSTLKTPFAQERALIVKHLTALDAFQPRFSILLQAGTSFQKIGAEFHATTKYDCSPQAGRKSIQNLKYSFYNSVKKQSEVLNCELHTKLRWDGMDHSSQDRIYFHPGKPDVQDGRVLIVHIGAHK